MSERWRCLDCNCIATANELLRAPNPFDPRQEIVGCPNCKAVDRFDRVCEVDDCNRTASCGWTDSKGTRHHTCGEHMNWAECGEHLPAIEDSIPVL